MIEKEDLKCAPDKQHSDGSCFTLESLKNIAMGFNESIRNGKIKDKQPIKISDNKRKLVIDLTNRLENICDDRSKRKTKKNH